VSIDRRAAPLRIAAADVDSPSVRVGGQAATQVLQATAVHLTVRYARRTAPTRTDRISCCPRRRGTRAARPVRTWTEAVPS